MMNDKIERIIDITLMTIFVMLTSTGTIVFFWMIYELINYFINL